MDQLFGSSDSPMENKELNNNNESVRHGKIFNSVLFTRRPVNNLRGITTNLPRDYYSVVSVSTFCKINLYIL
ncbi:hypothetical protein ROHU_034475 [Labeo rohita]|uniref:Uncharacterized protein n=1 Tax=Labeo rohita TaxID=84645 RepID=A0A498L454_LABRO|nr:hypothetical protein ROHU_034475 [Labeo rohita]